eukprot:4747450-Pyramimonas_sp.AAC.1
MGGKTRATHLASKQERMRQGLGLRRTFFIRCPRRIVEKSTAGGGVGGETIFVLLLGFVPSGGWGAAPSQPRIRRSRMEDGGSRKRVGVGLPRRQEHGRLRALWWVRAGLVDPAVPARTVAGILGEFPTGECQAVSQESVGRVRDALCNIILGISQSEIRALAASACDDGTFILHRVHDECSMRLRSYSASAHTGVGLPVRGPTSKIQNNVITIYGPGESGH